MSSTAERPSANGLGLEVRLVAEQPELVKVHLAARGASEEVLASVDEMATLYDRRKELITRGDAAREIRKRLSGQIGKLMKEGKTEEAEELKKQVEAANADADVCDKEQSEVDEKCGDSFTALPNLVSRREQQAAFRARTQRVNLTRRLLSAPQLDDSTPTGSGEEENEVVSEWGTDQRKVGEDGVYKWHDEIAVELNGWKADEAAMLSGARFSVLAGPVAKLERALTQFFLDSLGKKVRGV